MIKMIELNKIDKLLEEYKDFKNKGETFSEFIDCTKDNEVEVWEWVDSIGIVCKGDFENHFNKEFIENNFEDLVEKWFKGINAQVDFGVVLDCIKEEILEKNGKNI